MVLYESHDAAQTGPFLFAGIRCVRSSSRVLLSVLTALANSKSGERYHKKGRFSLLGGEYQPLWVLEKNRTSLRKSNSPTLSVLLLGCCQRGMWRATLTTSSWRGHCRGAWC